MKRLSRVVSIILLLLRMSRDASAVRIQWEKLDHHNVPSEIVPGSVQELDICAPYSRGLMHPSTQLKFAVNVDLVASNADGLELSRWEFDRFLPGTRIDMLPDISISPVAVAYSSQVPRKVKISVFKPRMRIRASREGKFLCFSARGEAPLDFENYNGLHWEIAVPKAGKKIYTSRILVDRVVASPIADVAAVGGADELPEAIEELSPAPSSEVDEPDVQEAAKEAVGDPEDDGWVDIERPRVESLQDSVASQDLLPGGFVFARPFLSMDMVPYIHNAEQYVSIKYVGDRIPVLEQFERNILAFDLSFATNSPEKHRARLNIRKGLESFSLFTPSLRVELSISKYDVTVRYRDNRNVLFGYESIAFSHPIWSRIMDGSLHVCTFRMYISGSLHDKLDVRHLHLSLTVDQRSTFQLVQPLSSRKFYSQLHEIEMLSQLPQVSKVLRDRNSVEKLRIYWNPDWKINMLAFCSRTEMVTVEVRNARSEFVEGHAVQLQCDQVGIYAFLPLSFLPHSMKRYHQSIYLHVDIPLRPDFSNMDIPYLQFESPILIFKQKLVDSIVDTIIELQKGSTDDYPRFIDGPKSDQDDVIVYFQHPSTADTSQSDLDASIQVIGPNGMKISTLDKLEFSRHICRVSSSTSSISSLSTASPISSSLTSSQSTPNLLASYESVQRRSALQPSNSFSVTLKYGDLFSIKTRKFGPGPFRLHAQVPNIRSSFTTPPLQLLAGLTEKEADELKALPRRSSLAISAYPASETKYELSPAIRSRPQMIAHGGIVVLLRLNQNQMPLMTDLGGTCEVRIGRNTKRGRKVEAQLEIDLSSRLVMLMVQHDSNITKGQKSIRIWFGLSIVTDGEENVEFVEFRTERFDILPEKLADDNLEPEGSD